jgi:hypothetical protein
MPVDAARFLACIHQTCNTSPGIRSTKWWRIPQPSSETRCGNAGLASLGVTVVTTDTITAAMQA